MQAIYDNIMHRFSSKLFVQANGSPMVFAMRPCTLRRNISDLVKARMSASMAPMEAAAQRPAYLMPVCTERRWCIHGVTF